MKASPASPTESEGGFYRISATHNLQELQPHDIMASISKDQYLYLDFGDESTCFVIKKT